jgi:hypothetical protein
MKKTLIVLALAIILLSALVSAHQPRIVSSSNAQEGIKVTKPEISKAYYSELKGKPHYYIINSSKEFALYAGILTPGKELTQPVSFEIRNETSLIYEGDGANFTWWIFYEDYGKQYYMAGPEYGKNFSSTHNAGAGVYTIKVFNEGNTGKYSLAIGDVESFPFTEVIKAIISSYRLKWSGFFG